MRKCTKEAFFAVALLSLSALAQAESGILTERDDCISNLRGVADANAAKLGYTVLRIDQGEYATLANGGVKCSAQFQLGKNGESAFSDVYSGEAYPRKDAKKE